MSGHAPLPSRKPGGSLAWRLWRHARLVLLAGLGLLGLHAHAATYTSGSTSYVAIDSSTHTKIGYNTAPYKFTAASGCGTSPPVLDDTLSDALPIGFTFTYGTASYTTVRVMTNGRLQFGNVTCGSGTNSIGPPQTYPYGYPHANMNATMKVFGVDLDPTNLVDKPNYPSSSSKTPCANSSTCYVSFATIGSTPARQFVVTWKSVPEWVTASNTSGSFDLQVILNEDGTFVYQYGVINHGGSGTAQIGWQLTTSDYQVLSFGAALEPAPFSAIKFYLPAPLATYSFDEGAWASGLAGQVKDSSASARHGTAQGGAQTSSTGKICRAADIAAHTSASPVNAVQTGINISTAALNLQGTGSVGFWYRSNLPWNGATAQAVQLLDATAANGQWFFLSKTAAGALVFEVTDSTGVVRSVTSAAQTFAANTWVHVAITWNFNGSSGSNQDSLQIFVNAGTPAVSAFTSTGTVTTQAGFLYVGDNPIGIADTAGSVNSANGQMDEVEIYNYPLTQAQVNTLMGKTHSCSTFNIDHLEIQHSSGSGVTCAQGTLTIRACSNPACTSLYTGGVSGTLNAAGTPTVNWDGSTGYGPGASFAIPSGSSSVNKNFQATSVGSVVLGMGNISPSTTSGTVCNFGSPSCTWSATDSGFIFKVPDHVAETSLSITVSAVKTSSSSLACTPAFGDVSKTVTFACSYANPSKGTLPVRIAGKALNTGNNTAAACDGSGAGVSLAFDSTGVATTTLQYADVGSVGLTANYTGGSTGTESGLVMKGTASFVARPSTFTVSSIKCTSTTSGNCAAAGGTNPAATSASGGAFIPAGANFSATITAVNAAGAATPNFGREASPEGVTLGSALVLPSGGSLGTLAGGSVTGSNFSSGVAVVSKLSYSEVGIIALTPSLTSGSYLNTGSVTSTASGNVGRFIPAKFVLSSPALTHRSGLTCSPASTFTHLGENFSLGFTLTAQNTAGTTTANYTGSFAKLDLTSAGNWNLAGLDGATSFSTASGRLSLGTSTGAWSNGVAKNIVLIASATRATTPDGPFNTTFGIAPTDSDGVAMSAFDMPSASGGSNDHTTIASVPLRFGRLRLSSAVGPADRPLPLPVTAQYWNGSAWATNTLDSCTTVPTSAFSFGNLMRTITAADTAASGPITLAAGTGLLKLAAPSSGHLGTYDVALSLGSTATDASCLQTWTPATGDAATTGANLAFLRGAWCGTSYAKDPSARATFGQQSTQQNLLYRRENY